MTETGFVGVTPDRLREVVPEFRLAAQDTLNLMEQLDYTTRFLIGELQGASLSRSPDALDGLWAKWRNALTNLSQSMQTVASNMEVAANTYQTTDQNVMRTNP